MIVPVGERVRVVKSAPAVRDPGALAAYIASPAFLDAARVLKVEDERSSVLVGELPSTFAAEWGFAGPGAPNGERDTDGRARVVVKVMAHDRPIKHFVQRAFGSTRHLRQWRGAELLMKHGFAAARPMVVFRARGMVVGEAATIRDESRQAESRVSFSPALSQGERGAAARRAGLVEVLVLEWLPGKTLLQHMADGDLSLKQEHALADAVGVLAGTMLDKSLATRDFKPSNIVVSWHHGVPRVGLVDTADVGRVRGCAARLSMAFALAVEPRGLRCLPRRALCWRAIKAIVRSHINEPDYTDLERDVRFETRELWQDLREPLFMHGSGVPKVNPLGSGVR